MDPNVAIQSLVDEIVQREQELGIQVAAYLQDELVVDVSAGAADELKPRLVDHETLFPIFSATKGITAAALHLQVERGLVDYEAPIARYWPEFGQEGKDPGDHARRIDPSHRHSTDA